MKVSLNWAQEYSNVDLKKIDKRELLDKIGAQLGAIDEIAEWGPKFDGVVAAKVVSCEKHGNADKLSICLIDDAGAVKSAKRDKNGLVQVVCGAPNVAAGQLVAWIPPGVAVPSTFDKDPFVLEAREIRGVVSNGMIASPSELGISSDHNGILVIEPEEIGSTNAKRGVAFKKLYGLDDTVIDIENKMFTHRPDCFGILGIARELAGINHMAFVSPAWYDEFAKIESETKNLPLDATNQAGNLVPRFSAAVMAGVKVKPSPYFMQSALTRAGIKPINNVVDVTNFVMHLTGQPLHAYDYDKVKGSKTQAELGVRMSKNGEELLLLGGKKLKLNEGAVVITDGDRPIGLGGVMGGADTEVDGKTQNIIVECANFEMNTVRKTSMAYGLFTDASTRFTKGQSPRQNMAVLAYAVTQLKKYAGGQVAGKPVDLKSQKFAPFRVAIDNAALVGDRLGLPGLTLPAIKHLLSNVEFEFPEHSGKGLVVEVPFWRTDIQILEDIVEEVGRLYGYDKLPQELPTKPIDPAKTNSGLALKSKLREILSSAGANEVLTYSFVHGSLLEAAGQHTRYAYHIRNAISPDLQYYRMSLAASLLEKIHPNVKLGYKDFAIFEIGKAHNKNYLDEHKLPKELDSLAFVITKSKISGAPYYWAKHYLEYLLAKLNIEGLSYEPLTERQDLKAAAGAYEFSRSVYASSGGVGLAIVGEPTAELRTRLKLPPGTAMFELDLAAIEALAGPIDYAPVNRFPSLEQDLCLRSDTKITYQELTGSISKFLDKQLAAHGYQYRLAPLDVYQKDDKKDQKQTTWRISLRHELRTLTTAEANKLLDELADELKAKLNTERV